ncbi:hypothetical protein H6G17_30075 [Chroococcidiopsis sp. FACHB-1243]|uniref:hypothetical protein n=1 Tax=Chroococcidiopsis sp. [FACHB-1243] TaxID=2692781 RepID=UPI001782BE52|nr:hypothetical protein [Chroococcidiopsis sp. [FACHB-1243]]MBD2309673.1 hypothetical protein [Chroococcidiopsis sp. [FACHB-1243]]
MFEVLKLYPNKTSLFVGIAIDLCTYIVSTSLCVFASGCSNGNPFFPLAAFLESLVVGIYCSWLVKGKLKLLVGFVVTLLTIFAILLSGVRVVFDRLLGGESFLSHSLLYGVITLIFAFAISLLNKSQEQN